MEELLNRLGDNVREEIWKDIKGYEGSYQVSSLGQIKSLERTIVYNNRWGSINTIKRREKILKHYFNNKGYCIIRLCKKGKDCHRLVHRLVAEAFIPNPNNLPEVNHKDENKENNCVDNLHWCTRVFNNNYGKLDKNGRRKIASQRMKRVAQYTLDGKLMAIYDGIRVAEEKTKIDNRNICACCKGKIKTASGYVWRYVNE